MPIDEDLETVKRRTLAWESMAEVMGEENETVARTVLVWQIR